MCLLSTIFVLYCLGDKLTNVCLFSLLFQQTLALSALAKEVDLPAGVVQKKMMLWVNQGIVVETPGPSYRLVQDQVTPVKTKDDVIDSYVLFYACFSGVVRVVFLVVIMAPSRLYPSASACNDAMVFVRFLFLGAESSRVRGHGCDVDGG